MPHRNSPGIILTNPSRPGMALLNGSPPSFPNHSTNCIPPLRLPNTPTATAALTPAAQLRPSMRPMHKALTMVRAKSDGMAKLKATDGTVPVILIKMAMTK